ncbi:hypothetical protein M0802_006692 [Mischocyttarus mexicanus]|nr:hypothetical protein M0802_006692 [Mischocyttarus mexicanus]
MWRTLKRSIAGSIQLIMQCGCNNADVNDVDDISEYDIHDVSVHFQPQIFPMALQQRQQDFQHRPDAPGTRRCSPPEIVSKMIQALEELTETNSLAAVDKVRDCHQLHFKSSYRLVNEENS